MASGALIRSEWVRCFRIAAAAGLCFLLVSCSGATYSGPEWSARVIDTETGAPIEGAIVVAQWELERYGGHFAGWLFVAEAVTDKDGIFKFPAWGPTAAAPDEGSRTRMSPNVPSIAIFKPDYRILVDGCCSLTGYLSGGYGTGPATRLSWANGKIFALTPFHGDLNKYREEVSRNIPLSGPSCAFGSIPRIYAAAILESTRLQKLTGRGIPDLSLKQFQSDVRFQSCTQTVLSALERYLK